MSGLAQELGNRDRQSSLREVQLQTPQRHSVQSGFLGRYWALADGNFLNFLQRAAQRGFNTLSSPLGLHNQDATRVWFDCIGKEWYHKVVAAPVVAADYLSLGPEKLLQGWTAGWTKLLDDTFHTRAFWNIPAEQLKHSSYAKIVAMVVCGAVENLIQGAASVSYVALLATAVVIRVLFRGVGVIGSIFAVVLLAIGFLAAALFWLGLKAGQVTWFLAGMIAIPALWLGAVLINIAKKVGSHALNLIKAIGHVITCGYITKKPLVEHPSRPVFHYTSFSPYRDFFIRCLKWDPLFNDCGQQENPAAKSATTFPAAPPRPLAQNGQARSREGSDPCRAVLVDPSASVAVAQVKPLGTPIGRRGPCAPVVGAIPLMLSSDEPAVALSPRSNAALERVMAAARAASGTPAATAVAAEAHHSQPARVHLGDVDMEELAAVIPGVIHIEDLGGVDFDEHQAQILAQQEANGSTAKQEGG